MRFCGACGTSVVDSGDRPSYPAPRSSMPTMTGMPVVSVPPPAPVSAPRPSGGDVIPITSQHGRRAAPAAQRAGNPTLLGMPAVNTASSVPPPPRRAPAGAFRERTSTAPGFGSVPPAPQAGAPPSHEAPRDVMAAQAPSEAPPLELPSFPAAAPLALRRSDADAPPPAPPPTRRSRRLVAIAVALALLGAIALGAAFALFARFAAREAPPEPRAHAYVETVGGKESLVVEVPRANYGARVRFAGHEAPLVAARAVLPLDEAALSVGENRLAVGLVEHDGRAEELPVEVTLPYRIRPDLSLLGEEPPRFRVRVEALPGSVVALDGKRLALDARGRGQRDFPLRGQPLENAIVETVRYEVVPPGGAATRGEVTARIPIATLELDRPGRAFVTDADSVVVEGAVHATATVSVNGVPVQVRGGRFRHVLALPSVGEHDVTVVARESGHAPEREALVVRRVADLAAEARAYHVDPTVTYTRIAADPDGSRGRRVALEGTVYNVDVRRGSSMLQVLVSRCGAARCPLWVTYPAATDVELGQVVRVVGEVDGEQRFRTNGPTPQILTVPRVRAVYVLPASPRR